MSTDSYDFNRQLSAGEAGEFELDRHFRARYKIQRISRDAQKAGIDRVFTSKRRRHRYTVEYKTDARAAATGNAFIETVSVDAEDKAGWGYTSCAQIVAYYVPPTHKVYLAETMRIKHELPKWESSYPTRSVPNDGYNTIGVLVPLDVFAAVCFVVEDVAV